MICLSYADSSEWLSQKGVRIDENRNLWFPRQQTSLMTTVPKRALAMSHFSLSLSGWLGAQCERFFWVSSWNTEPSHQLDLLEALRFAHGETRPIIDAPGHVFLLSDAKKEEAAITAMIFLIIAFNWEGYVVLRDRDDFVFLGDEHLVFSSGDGAKMRQLAELLEPFELETIKDVKEAWR